MSNILYCVYMHTLPNGKRYVGISQNPIRRWNSGRGYRKNPTFFADIEKYGWDNIQHEILYEGLSHQFAKQVEHNLIVEYKTMSNQNGYNRSPSGDCKDITDETREKMRLARMGNKYSLGHFHPEERKKKISESLKRHYAPSEEHPNGLHGANWGKKFSEESRRKMSESKKKYAIEHREELISKLPIRRGGEHGNSRKIIRTDKDGNEVFFESMADALVEIGLPRGRNQGIVRCCKGVQKEYLGYKWQYA